ncbi:MAG: cytidine deaminase [Nitrososphaerota archaeon]|jgi:cytidine deaminase|nr:cytidine deaminase [Nitrososphaerota archaeon]
MVGVSSKRLERLAADASKLAYSPYSKVKVGAALLTSDGRVFTGCNIENSSYGLTICAERVAAVKAVSEGSRKFKKIVLTSNLPGFTYPCGACRQFLSEFSDGLKVEIISRDRKRREFALEKLFPNAFLLRQKERAGSETD